MAFKMPCTPVSTAPLFNSA